MEYVEGKSLHTILQKQGALNEEVALSYIRQIASALQEVHNKNVLHRDVKPENIIKRSNADQVVLIDFGIAREFLANTHVTHTAVVTDGYAPVEQYRKGSPKGNYIDVYALAATLYVLLTGYTNGQSHYLVRALDREDDIRYKKPDPLISPNKINRNISSWVNDAIMQGMAVNYKKRSQNVEEWLKLLRPPSTQKTIVIPTTIPRPNPPIGVILSSVKWSLFLIFIFILYYFRPDVRGPISSPRNIDSNLIKLEEFLAAQKFEDADQETQYALQFLVYREGQSFTKESIDEIRCAELSKINKLWTKYSKEKFGFTIQSKIWMQRGGQPGVFDENVADSFGQQVKWQVNGKWYGEKPNYTSSAPRGHLPFLVPTSSTEKFGIPYIAKRLESCNIRE